MFEPESVATWSCAGNGSAVPESATTSTCVGGEWSVPECEVIPEPSLLVKFLHWVHVLLQLPSECMMGDDTPDIYDDVYWCAGTISVAALVSNLDRFHVLFGVLRRAFQIALLALCYGYYRLRRWYLMKCKKT